MSIKFNPNLITELKKYGAKDVATCFNCGNCTAVCPLSSEDHSFPRQAIRYVQLGAEDKIKASLDPWMCYYCGECTETCPRDAKPGETMMALRRFLTSRYDWTGFARKFYTSKVWEIVSILLVGIIISLVIIFFHGNASMETVELTQFLPTFSIDIVDWSGAFILSLLLLSNVLRMRKFFFHGIGMKRVPLFAYIKPVLQLPLHFFTQKKFNSCDQEDTGPSSLGRWLSHLVLMLGYVTMLVMVIFLLHFLQHDSDPYTLFYLPRMLGFLAFGGLMYGTLYAIIGRIRKSKPAYQQTHSTDWVFLILLFLVALTGFLVVACRFLGYALPTYVIFTIHLSLAVPMLVLEVPFAKWSHLAYRPFAIYLSEVKKAAESITKKKEEEAQKKADKAA